MSETVKDCLAIGSLVAVAVTLLWLFIRDGLRQDAEHLAKWKEKWDPAVASARYEDLASFSVGWVITYEGTQYWVQQKFGEGEPFGDVRVVATGELAPREVSGTLRDIAELMQRKKDAEAWRAERERILAHRRKQEKA